MVYKIIDINQYLMYKRSTARACIFVKKYLYKTRLFTCKNYIVTHIKFSTSP